MIPWFATRASGAVIEVPRKLIMITNNGLLMLESALAGEGLAFLPYWGVSEALADGSLEEIILEDANMVKSTGPEMSMYMLYDPKRIRLGKVRVMVDFLNEALVMSS